MEQTKILGKAMEAELSDAWHGDGIGIMRKRGNTFGFKVERRLGIRLDSDYVCKYLQLCIHSWPRNTQIRLKLGWSKGWQPLWFGRNYNHRDALY